MYSEADINVFSAVNATMVAVGGVPDGVQSSVLSVWLGPENKYAFVEMYNADCATIALGLNGNAKHFIFMSYVCIEI